MTILQPLQKMKLEAATDRLLDARVMVNAALQHAEKDDRDGAMRALGEAADYARRAMEEFTVAGERLLREEGDG